MELTREEIDVIKRTWKVINKTPSETGEAMLINFLNKYPDNVEKFPFKDIPIEDLTNNARFRAHCIRVIKIFDDSINELEVTNAVDKMSKIWEAIAFSHFKRNISRQSFLDFRECILEVCTQFGQLEDEQVTIWAKLLDAVIKIIFDKEKDFKRRSTAVND